MPARSGLSLTSIVVLLAILAGIALGPVQAVYCVFMSGKQAGEYPLKPNETVTIPLSSDMNPIRFNASIRHEDPRSMRREVSRFDGTLTLADKAIWTETFSVSSEDDDDDRGSGITINANPMTNTTVGVHSFEVTETGDYQFQVKQTKSELRVEEMSLLVRSNSRLVNMPSCIVGIAMLVIGVVVGFVRLVRSSNRQPNAAG